MNENENDGYVVKTMERVKLSKLDSPLFGTYEKNRTITIRNKDRKEGEPEFKDVEECILKKDDGEKVCFITDAGFKQAFNEADVQPGHALRITRGEQQDLGNGKRVNTYEIGVKPV